MKFRGTTEEGEIVEFKIYCEDSDKVTEYGSELGVDIDGWKYIKKDTLVCLEVEDLERQLAEAREENKQLKTVMIRACRSTHSSIDEMVNLIEQLREKSDE